MVDETEKWSLPDVSNLLNLIYNTFRKGLMCGKDFRRDRAFHCLLQLPRLLI